MAGLYFAHNGLLNDWAASNGIEVVDAGQPLLSYDATPDGAIGHARRQPERKPRNPTQRILVRAHPGRTAGRPVPGHHRPDGQWPAIETHPRTPMATHRR